MSFSDELRRAARMELRPNPTMHFHCLLSKRWTEHRDTFAYWDAENPEYVQFAVELRTGGVEIAGVWVYEARLWDYAPPVPLDIAVASTLQDDDRAVFTSKAFRPYHAWMQRYHHLHMRELVRGLPLRPGAKRTSCLFHYLPAREYDPFASFVNEYKATPPASSQPWS